MSDLVVVVVLAYLFGSLPFAFLVARRAGVDLRQAGSRNLGAANVLRTTGTGAAVFVLICDVTKGALAVIVAQAVSGDRIAIVAAGVAAIVGHIYPAWLGFKGGKGVATAAGVFAVLAPAATAVAALVFVATVFITRFVSAGSIAGALVLPVTAAASDASGPVVAGAAVAALIVLHRHRDNVSRLIAGTERRIGLRL